jgi:hypothetical protein
LILLCSGFSPEILGARSAAAGREPQAASSNTAETPPPPKQSEDAQASQPKPIPGAAPDFATQPAATEKTAQALRSNRFKKALSEWFQNLGPNQGGIVWLAVLVTLLVAFDFKNWKSWRNLDLLLLLAPAFLMIDIIRFSTPSEDAAKLTLAGLVFLGLFVFSATFFVRAMVGALGRPQPGFVPNLTQGALLVLVVILLACNTLLTLQRNPDDCGLYTNLGAKRMLERGKYPYGDPMLRNGAAATYGPILYLAHMPFQLVLPPADPAASAVRKEGKAAATDDPHTYRWPPVLATKLALLSFHALGVVALFLIGRQLGSSRLGLALIALYVGSAYVQGIGGERWQITGVAFISHIAPAAVTLLAFALRERPLWSGAILAMAAGVLFYPAFLFPLWLGYYFWRKKGWLAFAASFLSVCLVIGVSVLAFTEAGPNETVLQVIHESTVGHQESKDAYGSSTFSFWGTHPRLAGFWQQPLIPGIHLLKPAFVVFLVFLGASFFLARGRTVAQFAFLTAAVPIAIQLWKSHAGGTYVEWYLPFLLIGLFGGAQTEAANPETEAS